MARSIVRVRITVIIIVVVVDTYSSSGQYLHDIGRTQQIRMETLEMLSPSSPMS
jgi:hypothetical protein